MMVRTLFIAAVALVPACSVYDGMKNMEKNTAEMNRTTREMKDATETVQAKTSQMSTDTEALRRATEKMSKTTEGMAQTTDAMHSETTGLKRISSDLDRQTGDLYEDARQGTSLELRLKILDHMNSAKKQFAKIKYANFYFKSLEFQLWKGAGRDDSARLDHLRLEAVQEVIQSIDELAPEGKRSISPLSNQNNMQNLYALGAALHVVNQNQSLPDLSREPVEGDKSETDQALTEGHEPVGVLRLFYDALEAKQALDNGMLDMGDLRAYQASVLKFEEIATFILRLRVNFLTAITVKQLAAKDGDSLNLLDRISMWLKPWHAQTDTRNTVQLRYYGWVLDEARATRDKLTALGIEVPVDETLVRVAKHAHFGRLDKNSSRERNAAIKDLSDRLSDLTGEHFSQDQ